MSPPTAPTRQNKSHSAILVCYKAHLCRGLPPLYPPALSVACVMRGSRRQNLAAFPKPIPVAGPHPVRRAPTNFNFFTFGSYSRCAAAEHKRASSHHGARTRTESWCHVRKTGKHLCSFLLPLRSARSPLALETRACLRQNSRICYPDFSAPHTYLL